MNEALGMVAKTNIAFKRFFNIQLIVSDLDIRTSCSQKYTSVNSPEVDGEYDKWNMPCSTSYSITNRLSDFSKWRGSRRDKIDVWHLFSSCSSESKVGLAWPSAVCKTEANLATGNLFYSSTSVSTRQQDSWKVMAHELAHNFGALHDCLNSCFNCIPCSPSCDCKGRFIMNPNQNVGTDDFGSGSIKDVCNAIPTFSCLKDSSDAIFTYKSNVCGNGIKEDNEECDCGDLCDTDQCCTPDCKLKPQAVCSDSNQSCCTNCQFKPVNTICRLGEGSCDSEEVCSGQSGDCPKDSYKENGQSCNENGFIGKCASKYCTTLDKQCKDAYPKSTGACSGLGITSDCLLTCTTENGCSQFQSFLIDGSPCGGSFGSCEQGVCAFKSDCTNLFI